MPRTIEVSDSTHARFMTLVTPLMSADAVLQALLDKVAPVAAPGPPVDTNVRPPAAMKPQTEPSPVQQPARSASSQVLRVQAAPVRRKVVARAKRGESTDRRVYMRHILAEIARAGGSATVDDTRKALEQRLSPILTEVDLQPLANNPRDTRWWNHARFARQRLVDHGLLQGDSSYGTWALTEEGWKLGRRLLRNVNDPSVDVP